MNLNEKGLEYRGDTLYYEGLSLKEIAREFGTPLYVYSARKIKENFLKYSRSFRDIEAMICFALKANSSGKILKILALMGAGADVVSGGELYLALKAGIDPGKIVFAGVGKTAAEIEMAVREGICFINIESAQELETVAYAASSLSKDTGISFRINPDIDPRTHPSISTGLKENKFGIPPDEAFDLYLKAASMKNISVKGVHVHVGSQMTNSDPIKESARQACLFSDRLREKGIDLSYIDIGGGLGINYDGTLPPSPADIAGEISGIFKERPEKLVLEPGRSVCGDGGLMLTRINYVKKSPQKNFVIVDAGFNDLVRPSLYGSYHRIIPALRQGEEMKADIVGPVCESTDFLAESRRVEGVKQGNILAVLDAGAYGFSMSSNYNSRPRPAEVIIEEEEARLIRRREEYRDLEDTEVEG